MVSIRHVSVLREIEAICRNNQFGVAPMEELARRLPGVDRRRIKAVVHYLRRGGYIESPIRGCYRLTEKGLWVLRNIGVEGGVGGVREVPDESER